MNVYEVNNPVLVTQVLQDSFIAMDRAEFLKTLRNTLDRAETFVRSDDTEFSASLSQSEGTMYACHVRSFLDALKDLQRTAGMEQVIAACSLARTIASWQTISVFRTMHRKV